MFDGFECVGSPPAAPTSPMSGGIGAALLLLHATQTKAIWDRVAARLARKFTIVAADLRGYGDSSKPPGGPDQPPMPSAPWRRPGRADGGAGL